MIYVDDLHENPPAVLREKRLPASMRQTCHLVCDGTEAEELAFIRHLGLLPRWRHGEHYDLVPAKRSLAVHWGAVEAPSRVLVCRSWRRRERLRKLGRPCTCLCGTCNPQSEAAGPEEGVRG